MYPATNEMVMIKPSALLETVEIGRDITIRWEMYPERVRKLVLEQAAKKGISEKEFINRLQAQQTASTVASQSDFSKVGLSIEADDVISNIIDKSLGLYDKALDEAILASDNIVKAYNDSINAHFDAARKEYEELNKQFGDLDGKENSTDPEVQARIWACQVACNTNTYHTIISGFGIIEQTVAGIEMTEEEVRKVICEAMYQPTDDPAKIQKIVKARIDYNNLIISQFRAMLQNNYGVLNITKDEALMLSESLESKDKETKGMAIDKVKELVLANEAKFKIAENTWDLRSVGGGCLFVTGEDLGNIADMPRLDHILQPMMKYDAVVIGHGASSNAKADRYIQEENQQSLAKWNKVAEQEGERVTELTEKLKKLSGDDLNEKQEKLISKLNSLMDQYDKDQDRLSSEYESVVEKIHKLMTDLSPKSDEYKQYEKLLEENRKKYEDQSDKMSDHFNAQYDQYAEAIDKLTSDNNDNSDHVSTAEEQKLREELDAANAEYTQKVAEINKNYFAEVGDIVKQGLRIKKKFESESHWTIQPVKTLHAGPFTDVNDLVHQLIKEGFKNIMLFSCNPGGHSLAKDIIDNKNVTVRMANTTILAESANTDPSDPLFITEATLAETEQDLIRICNECGYHYGDDNTLNEMTASFESAYTDSLNEGVAGNIWAKVKEIIKKAIGYLVSIFKKIIGFFKGILDRIKAFFRKVLGSGKVGTKFSKSVKSGAILVESARVNKYSATGWDQLESVVTKSCESISKKIQMLEQKQTKNMQELDRYAEKMSRSTNESANPKMDQLIGMLW